MCCHRILNPDLWHGLPEQRPPYHCSFFKAPSKLLSNTNFIFFIAKDLMEATKLCEIFTLLLSYVVSVKSRWRFLKILWPSQNIWTLWMPLCRIRSKLITFVFYCDRNRMRSKYLGGFKDLFRLQDPLSEKQDNSRSI